MKKRRVIVEVTADDVECSPKCEFFIPASSFSKMCDCRLFGAILGEGPTPNRCVACLECEVK